MIATRILFVCTKNAVRSPIAEALGKQLSDADYNLDFQSAGIDPSDVDGFAIAVMAEQGIDIQRHESQDIAAFVENDFDLLICLSEPASNHARRQFGSKASNVEHWDVGDPSLVEGNRDQKLAAYRAVRDNLTERIRQRFSL